MCLGHLCRYDCMVRTFVTINIIFGMELDMTVASVEQTEAKCNSKTTSQYPFSDSCTVFFVACIHIAECDWYRSFL